MDDLSAMDAVEHRTQTTLRWLLLMTAAAAALRLGMTVAFVGLSSPPDLGASPDQAEYLAILEQLAEGNVYANAEGLPTARRAPGMVFTLLPGYAMSGGSDLITRITLIGLSSITCLFVGLTVSRLFGARAGLLAAGTLAVMPGHAYYAMHLLSEAPFGFWFAVACYLSVVAMQRERRSALVFIAAGLCWGAAILTKPQFVLLAPLAGVAILVYAARHRAWRPVLSGALCLAAASAVVMPWYLRNAVALDSPGLSTIGGYGLWAGNNELVLNDPDWRGRAMPTSQIEQQLGVKLPEGEAASDAQAKQYALAFMREHRAEMPGLTAWKLYRLATPFQATDNRAVFWAQALSWIVLAPCFLTGVVIALRRRPVESMLWLGPIVVTIGVSAVFFAIVRYRDTLLPAMVPFAAIAIDSAIRRGAIRHRTRETLGSIAPESGGEARPLAA